MNEANKDKPLDKDVVVVGGGMVGAATAVGLAQLGLSVALIETFEPEQYSPEQALDLRVSAISVASERLLERLGAFEAITSMRQVVYKGVETWEDEGCITRFNSQQLGVDHLGHIVENRVVQLALWQKFANHDNLELICPARVETFERLDDAIKLTLDNQRTISTRLLVGADGAESQVRLWAGIGVTGWDYSQAAMLINVKIKLTEPEITWQQFTPKGPRSLLPLPNDHASLVWYDDASRIAQLSALKEDALAEQIRCHFPARLNQDFKVLKHGSFKLTRRHAQRYHDHNVVILGDAAHTINPLAGQGVNLGFKDVNALIDTITDAMVKGSCWWHKTELGNYQRRRYLDNQLMMTTMDLFYSSFSNDLRPLKLLRNGALKLANIDTPVKKRVLKYAMGL